MDFLLVFVVFGKNAYAVFELFLTFSVKEMSGLCVSNVENLLLLGLKTTVKAML